MKLWKISQKVNNDYDTYDSAIVVARSALSAKKIHPGGKRTWDKEKNTWTCSDFETDDCSWAKLPDIECEYVGKARSGMKQGLVLCASFNAG